MPARVGWISSDTVFYFGLDSRQAAGHLDVILFSGTPQVMASKRVNPAQNEESGRTGTVIVVSQR